MFLLCAGTVTTAGGVFNVLLIMGANMVGFVLGVDGARYFVQELVSSWACASPVTFPESRC